MTLFPLLERVHGHLAVLGLALLLHPCLSLRLRPVVTRATRLSCVFAALLLWLPGLLGAWLYPLYRQHRRPLLEPSVALVFESKEHLGWLCLVLVLAGTASVLLVPERRRLASDLLLLAFGCGLLSGLLGLLVAAAPLARG